MLAWGRVRGFAPTFFIGFSAFDVFRGKCGCKDDLDRALAFWPDYLRGVKRCMNAWGVPDADYNIEVYDEPNPRRFDEIRRVLTVAKETLPDVKLTVTLGAEILDAAEMRDLSLVIRESVGNAVKHGHAQKVAIASDPLPDGWRLRIANDGVPFDASTAPGPSEGHFGLEGMKARARRLGAELTIAAENGRTVVSIVRKGKK